MKTFNLQIKKLHQDAKIPTYAYEGTDIYNCPEAGLDLYAYKDTVIVNKAYTVVGTGIAIQIEMQNQILNQWFKPFIKIESKSGLSSKYGIEIGAGVIDASYQNEILLVVHNMGDGLFTIDKGQKIAQAIPMLLPRINTIEVVDDFEDETERGLKGFGSSGND